MRVIHRIAQVVAFTLLAGCQAVTDDGGTSGVARTAAPTPVVLRETLAPPVWHVGDRWEYSDGYGVRVAQVTGDRTKFERLDAPTQWFINRGLFREETKSEHTLRQVVFRSEDPARFYNAPLKTPVIFEREYMNNGVLMRHSTSWVNEGRELITVPAGTFNAYKLTMRTRSLSTNWTGFERIWYVPEVRNYVRMEFRYGDGPESARVLNSYQLK